MTKLFCKVSKFLYIFSTFGRFAYCSMNESNFYWLFQLFWFLSVNTIKYSSVNTIEYFPVYISNHECLFQGYFDTARLELSEYNIGVQIICPGPVKSEIRKYAFSEDVNKVNRIFKKKKILINMDINGDWVRCVLWINKSRCVLCFVLAPGYAVSAKSRAHLKFF